LLVRFRLHGRDREVEQIRTFVARAPTTTVQSDTRWRQQHDALQFHKTASHQHVCCVFGIGGGGVFFVTLLLTVERIACNESRISVHFHRR
jgi:hypothetical protein